MRRVALAAIALLALAGVACAKDRTKDRICTPADVARFEGMFGLQRGQYHTDPRFAVTIHYLGTAIANGTCNVQLRLAD
jgi:hypothetical protein